LSSTSSNKFPVNFNHASVAGLNRAELRVVANLGKFGGCAIDEIDEELARSCVVDPAINRDCERHVNLPNQFRAMEKGNERRQIKGKPLSFTSGRFTRVLSAKQIKE
jgi:hypothetical protein